MFLLESVSLHFSYFTDGERIIDEDIEIETSLDM